MMRTTIATVAAVTACTLTIPAMASEKLAQSKGCMNCHAIDKTLPTGPSFKEIARLYKGTPSSEATMVSKVTKGGAEHWGQMHMPPNTPPVSEADAKTLVKWILTLK